MNEIELVEEKELTLWEHVGELRASLLRALIVSLMGMGIILFFSKEILLYFESLLPDELNSLAFFSPQEGMITVFKLSFWTGLFLTAPYSLFELLSFIAPALNKELKNLLLPFSFLSFLFMSLGLLLCLFFTLPLANNYLFLFNSEIGTNLWGFSAYFNYVLLLLFAHVTTFFLGSVLLLLVHLRILKNTQLESKRRHAIVLSLIIAALITPPDVLTQVIVAIPLYGFFEMAVLYAKIRTLREP